MGIRNKDGAMFWATGVDNSGLRTGTNEAMGILKAMASEVTSFDVFSGIGISAGIAFASAAKDSYNFEKEFQKNMLEVATISAQISDSMTDTMNQIIGITQEIPIKATDAAKALYQIVSAGHDGEDAMTILQASAKGAVGGLTDTATAADAVTTILNAYKLSADKAGMISDQLFTTVRLGKTNFGELGRSIAQAAPIAAAYGVEIDQVLAAVASLTKQGTPTAQAMTQIRASIIGVSKVLGDGAFDTRTYQEALEEVARRAGGSESKLRELVPEVEAVNAVLGMTGKNVNAAAADLAQMQTSLGATEAAYQKMRESTENQLLLLQNNITAALRPMGEAILKEVSEIASAFNDAFMNGDIETTFNTLQSLLTAGAAAWGTYKVATLLAAQAELYHQGIVKGWTLSMQLQANWLNILSKAKSVLTARTKALTAAMMKNPYAIAAAAVVALGYAIYKYITYQTEAEKQQEKLNEKYSEFTAETLKVTRAVNDVFSALNKTKQGTEERKKLINLINKEYGKYLPNLLTEKSSLEEIKMAYNTINTALKEQIALKMRNQLMDEIVTKGVKKQANELDKLKKGLSQYSENSGLVDNTVEQIVSKVNEAQKAGKSNLNVLYQTQRDLLKGIAAGNRKLNKEVVNALDEYIKNVYNTEYYVDQAKRKFAPFIKNNLPAEDGIEPTVTPRPAQPAKSAKKDYKGEILKSKQDQEKLIFQMSLDIQQARINGMEEGEAKYQEQRKLDFKKELLSIQEKGEALIKAQQEIERRQWEERNKDKKESERGSFIPATTKVEQLPREQQDLLSDLYTEAWIKKAENESQYRKNLYQALISQLNDYKSQEETLIKEWDDRIKQAVYLGDEELIAKMKQGKEKALSELSAQMLMESSDWIRLFGNLDTLTINELDNLINNIQEKVDEGNLNLTPVDLKALMEKLSEAKDRIAEINPFEAFTSSVKDMKKAMAELAAAEASGLTGDALDKYRVRVKQSAEDVKKSIAAVRKAYSQVSDVMKSVGELVSLVDEGLGQTVNNAIALGDAVMNVGEVVAQAVISFAAGMSAMESASVILLVIKAVLMAVMAVINLFNNDKKHEKKIQALQDQVDKLKRAYDNLGKAIEDAFSTRKAALIDKESENLRKQNELIRQQIQEEDAKKKTDHDKIKEWQNQIEDNNAQIEENTKKLRVEAIMGSEIQQAIDDFAQAYADAWTSGEKAAGKSANVVKNLIKTAIIDMLKNNLQPEVTRFMTYMSEAMTDGIIDPIEQRNIDEYEKRLEQIADSTLRGKEKWLQDEDTAKEGVTGQLKAAMTEGTASELVGLWNMTAIDIRILKELMITSSEEFRNSRINVNAIFEQTKLIQLNTFRTANNTGDIIIKLEEWIGIIKEELKSIKNNTKSYNGRG